MRNQKFTCPFLSLIVANSLEVFLKTGKNDGNSLNNIGSDIM